MNARIPLCGLVVACAIGLLGAPRVASAQTGTHDLQVYAGEIFGDRLTATPLTGKTPILNDDATFGARYTYDFPQPFALQLSTGYSPGRAAHVAGGDSNLELRTVDLDVLFYVTPPRKVHAHPFVLYTKVGMGYAWAHLSHALLGNVGGLPVRLAGSSGYTANIGIGVKYYLSMNLFVDFEARYRYLSRLLNHYGHGLNTAETTFGIGYSF